MDSDGATETEFKPSTRAQAESLATELASMHAVLLNLLLVLRNAKHTRFQEIMINQAFDQLKASQSRFPNL